MFAASSDPFRKGLSLQIRNLLLLGKNPWVFIQHFLGSKPLRSRFRPLITTEEVVSWHKFSSTKKGPGLTKQKKISKRCMHCHAKNPTQLPHLITVGFIHFTEDLLEGLHRLGAFFQLLQCSNLLNEEGQTGEGWWFQFPIIYNGGFAHPNGWLVLGFLPWTGRKCSPDFSFELASSGPLASGLVRTGALNRPVHKPWGEGFGRSKRSLAPAIYFHHNQKFSKKNNVFTHFSGWFFSRVALGWLDLDRWFKELDGWRVGELGA